MFISNQGRLISTFPAMYAYHTNQDVGLWEEGGGPKIATADILAALAKLLKDTTDRELTPEEIFNIRSMIRKCY